MNDVIDYYQHKEDSTDYAVTSDSKNSSTDTRASNFDSNSNSCYL